MNFTWRSKSEVGMKNFGDWLKAIKARKLWFVFLFVSGTVYVMYYRFEIYDLSSINARNLIFILWLILILSPLFSEIEFLGVKVKKEVEKAKEEVKTSIQNLQTQITQFQLNSSVENHINLGNSILPTEQKIEELRVIVRELQGNSHSSAASSPENQINETDKNVYLFKVRLGIEVALRSLCEKLGYENKLPILKMIQLLNRAELINGVTSDLINQVCKIANRGVHGEIVSDEYLNFVKETYPEVQRQLKDASARLRYTVCPKCGYSGYSTYENSCPQCNSVYSDD